MSPRFGFSPSQKSSDPNSRRNQWLIKMVKSNGKEPTTLIFNDFTLGLGEAELCFRLVHLWDAQNTSEGYAY
ncbi:hypothetical protein Bca52824_095307 [Brassica carinata]|uniref:Uncharacterized protein n=1 Tax=Brassica carinata TaxID=52824 RepID=A0A8X7TI48_BRACI|nr:hypothetical protein Bca52824_095307 [Brassica carinata]